MSIGSSGSSTSDPTVLHTSGGNQSTVIVKKNPADKGNTGTTATPGSGNPATGAGLVDEASLTITQASVNTMDSTGTPNPIVEFGGMSLNFHLNSLIKAGTFDNGADMPYDLFTLPGTSLHTKDASIVKIKVKGETYDVKLADLGLSLSEAATDEDRLALFSQIVTKLQSSISALTPESGTPITAEDAQAIQAALTLLMSGEGKVTSFAHGLDALTKYFAENSIDILELLKALQKAQQTFESNSLTSQLMNIYTAASLLMQSAAKLYEAGQKMKEGAIVALIMSAVIFAVGVTAMGVLASRMNKLMKEAEREGAGAAQQAGKQARNAQNAQHASHADGSHGPEETNQVKKTTSWDDPPPDDANAPHPGGGGRGANVDPADLAALQRADQLRNLKVQVNQNYIMTAQFVLQMLGGIPGLVDQLYQAESKMLEAESKAIEANAQIVQATVTELGTARKKIDEVTQAVIQLAKSWLEAVVAAEQSTMQITKG